MTAISRLIFAVILFWASAIGAVAQEFYLGALHEAHDGGTVAPGDPESAGFIGLAGIRVPVSERFFVAGEAEVLFTEDLLGVMNGFSGEENLHRYRAVVGANIDNLTLFLGTGTGELGGDAMAPDDAGVSINYGVDFLVNESLSIRVEAVQDNFGEGDWTLFESDSIRVGTLINF